MRGWIDAILSDSRFGLRMLAKHRGLTLVGAFAMAVAIAVGATLYQVFSEILDPALPFSGGDRVVSLHYVGANSANPQRRVLHDFAALRGQLTSVEHFGAFHNAQHNLVAANTAPEPVQVAEITSSAFAITGVPAAAGRYLLASDEPETAPPVVVIGHEAWQSHFAGDPNVVGRTIYLGGVPRTVVGVMPDGFKFPVDHQFWIPLDQNPLKYARWEGPSISMFGRLAPGVTMEQAQAEFAAVAQRTAAADPDTKQPLRSFVVPYTRENAGILDATFLWTLRIGQMLVGALAFVVAINLAILVYARTVARLGELAVRSALGASRRRILAQLFTEAFALSILGAGAGLMLAAYALGVIQGYNDISGGMPFWMTFKLSPGAVGYAFGLSVVAAVIMGVLPGLKATGLALSANLHELNGRSGTRLGPVWTTLVVAQVAVAVAVLPAAVYLTARVVRMNTTGPGFAAESIAAGVATFSGNESNLDSNLTTARQRDLISRLRAEPGVNGVAFSSNLPGFGSSSEIRFEEGVKLRKFWEYVPDQGVTTDTLSPSTTRVSVDLFDTFGVELLAGRTFNASDVTAASRTVVVNRSFAEKYLEQGNALGLRFHYVTEGAPQDWFQIVGVVRDFPSFPPSLTRDSEPTIYHPAGVGQIHPVTLSVRFAGAVPSGFINRFREVGAQVDPALQLRQVGALADRYSEERSILRSLAWAISLVTASVLLLSAAGIYALMSFTVAQRTREIGIRTALGAQPRRILWSVFARAVRQIAFGVVVGSVVSGAAFVAIGLGIAPAVPLLISVAVIMLIVGLLAALGPARRGLRIQASEALRADA
ncbi:MAG: ABC transporter permease [Vicinamibacterales bacterium]